MSHFTALILISLVLLNSSPARAQIFEPEYCKLDHFLKHQVHAKTQLEQKQFGLLRLRAFEFGNVKLVGLAVGLSVPSYVKKLAQQNSLASEDEKFCTWYFNKWNPVAEKQFNWKYLPLPFRNSAEVSDIYEKVLSNSFDQDLPSFISCLENKKYLAMGCNNMQHRGPSVFAMLLSFSGCSPLNSTVIANHLWGLNGIPFHIRLNIAQKGYELGNQRLYSRAKLQKIFTN